MSRELFTTNLQAAVRLSEAAWNTEDPHAALGLIYRAIGRLNAAKECVIIEAEARDVPREATTSYST